MGKIHSLPDDPPLSQAEADRLRDEVIRRMADTPPKPKGESRVIQNQERGKDSPKKERSGTNLD